MGLLDLFRNMSGKEDSSTKRSFSSRIPSFSKRRQEQQQTGIEDPLSVETSKTGDTPKQHSSRGAPYKRNFGFGFRKRPQSLKEKTNPSEMVQQLEASIGNSGGAMTKDSPETKQQNVPTQIARQEAIDRTPNASKTPNANRSRWGMKKSQTVVTDRNSNFALPSPSSTPEANRLVRNMPKSKSEESIKSTSSQERAKSGKSRLPKSHTMNPTRPLHSQTGGGPGSARVVKPVVRPQNLARPSTATATPDVVGGRVRTQSNASTASNVSSASSTRTPRRPSQETAVTDSGQKAEVRSSAVGRSSGKSIGGQGAVRAGIEGGLADSKPSTPARQEVRKDLRERGTPGRSRGKHETPAKSPKSPGYISSSKLKPESPLMATVRRDSLDHQNESASSDLESDDLMLDMESSHDEHEQSFDHGDERPRHHRRWHSPRRNTRTPDADADGRDDSDTLEELDTSHSQKSPRTPNQRIKKQEHSEENQVGQDPNATPESQRRRNRRRYRRRQYGRSRAQTAPSDSPQRDRPRSQSTPMKPPRQMTASFDEEEGVTIDTSSFRYLLQDMTGMKTCLLKLKRILQEVETSSPFEQSSAGKGFADKNHLMLLDGAVGELEGKDIKKENEDLRQEVTRLRQQLAEKDRTISLLQTQMEKYSDARDVHVAQSGKSVTVATQTEPQSKRFPWSRSSPLSRSQSMREPSPVTPGRRRRNRRQKNSQKSESDAPGQQPKQISAQRRSDRRSAQNNQDYLDPIEECNDPNLLGSDEIEESRDSIHHSSSSQQLLSETEQTVDILSVQHSGVSTHYTRYTGSQVEATIGHHNNKLQANAGHNRQDYKNKEHIDRKDSISSATSNKMRENITPVPANRTNGIVQKSTQLTPFGSARVHKSAEALRGAELMAGEKVTSQDNTASLQLPEKDSVTNNEEHGQAVISTESNKDSCTIPVQGAETTADVRERDIAWDIDGREVQQQQKGHRYAERTDNCIEQVSPMSDYAAEVTAVNTLSSPDHDVSFQSPVQDVEESDALNKTFSIEEDAAATTTDVLSQVAEKRAVQRTISGEARSEPADSTDNTSKQPMETTTRGICPSLQRQEQEDVNQELPDTEATKQNTEGIEKGMETIRERSLSFAGFGRQGLSGIPSYADVLATGPPVQGGLQPLRERSQSLAAFKGPQSQGRRGIPRHQKGGTERVQNEGVMGRSQSYTGLQEQGRSGIPSMKKNTSVDVNKDGALAKGKSQSMAALKNQGLKERRIPQPAQGRGGHRFTSQQRESSISQMRERSYTFPKYKAIDNNTEKPGKNVGHFSSGTAANTEKTVNVADAAPPTPRGGTAACESRGATGTSENVSSPKEKNKGRIPVFGKWYKR